MKIGVLGGGQLGRMMALAGYPLGFQFRFFDRPANPPGSSLPPAGQIAEFIAGNFDDEAALARFAEGLDLVTYEFENVPSATAHFLARHVPHFFPPPGALELAQDRLTQKQFFERLGIPAPTFRAVNSRRDLDAAAAFTGYPAVLKTRRWGYDGKGQRVISGPSNLDDAWAAMGASPLILETLVEFTREVSLVAARSVSGETAFYPLAENRHRKGILRVSIAPAPGASADLQSLAQEYALRIFQELKYVGVLTMEMFETGGRLLANEMATRVHNSGHWTIEGADVSQFENHLRAIADLPLGSAAARSAAAMVNFIGSVPDPHLILSIPAARLHLYGKAPRPGRKLGHATVCAADAERLAPKLDALQRLAAP